MISQLALFFTFAAYETLHRNYPWQISSQKSILSKYAKENGFKNPLFFVDDGYSETNFNRPSWSELLGRIENGEVSTLIIKNMPWLGRDYLKVDFYTEVLFVEIGEEITKQEDQAENIDRFIGKVRKYLNLDELTPAILNDMVKAVYVHAPDKSKGYREQRIDISYDLVGILPASLLNDLQNGETA